MCGIASEITLVECDFHNTNHLPPPSVSPIFLNPPNGQNLIPPPSPVTPVFTPAPVVPNAPVFTPAPAAPVIDSETPVSPLSQRPKTSRRKRFRRV